MSHECTDVTLRWKSIGKYKYYEEESVGKRKREIKDIAIRKLKKLFAYTSNDVYVHYYVSN